MKFSGGQIVAKALKSEKIHHVFGLIGYYVSPIFAACAEYGIKVIDTRHEQGAVHMADGFAEATGEVGVAILTGGPGFANGVSAIIKAYKACTPLLVITGGFEPHRKDNGGLEDMDQLALVKSFTKWCATVYDTKRIAEYIAMGIRYATTGRRGPVVLEIPINYLLNKIDEKELTNSIQIRTDAKIYGDPQKIQFALQVLEESKKPLLIVGNGVFYTKASKVLTEFVECTKIPAFTVNLGRGTIADQHELCFGSGRTIEGGPQIEAYRNADTIFVIGSTLDYSLSFGKPPIFNEKQKIIQVDIDPCEIGFSGRKIDVGIVGNSDSVLKQMLEIIESHNLFKENKFEGWKEELDNIYESFYDELLKSQTLEENSVSPIATIEAIKKVMPKNATIVVDGSNAMFWATSLFRSNEPGQLIVGPNGNYGQMGTGLPMAIGSKVAKPENEVILYTGDGSFGFNIIEVNTAIRFGIKVIIIVHNDSAWGFCRETQKNMFGEEFSSFGTLLGFTRYDEIVKAFGGEGILVKNKCELEKALTIAKESDKIVCINVVTQDIISPGGRFLNGTVK